MPSYWTRRWKLIVGIAAVAFAALILAVPPLVDRLLSSGFEVSAVQARLDEALPVGSTMSEAESVLTSLGVHYSFDDFANSLRGTIPESRDFNWMGVRRDLCVDVEFDERGLVRSCSAQDIFTFL